MATRGYWALFLLIVSMCIVSLWLNWDLANKIHPLGNYLATKCYDANKKNFRIEIDGQVYPQSVLNVHNSSIDFKCLQESSVGHSKLIVMWDSFFGAQFEPDTCPVRNCVFTQNRSHLQEADLVLVSNFWLKPQELPGYMRPAHQRWLLAIYESPLHTVDLAKFNGYFNLTSTYRRDSTVPGMYEMATSNWLKNIYRRTCTWAGRLGFGLKKDPNFECSN